MDRKVTEEMMEEWIGSDMRYDKRQVLNLLVNLANGVYKPKAFKKSVLDYMDILEKINVKPHQEKEKTKEYWKITGGGKEDA